ncbi:3-oxoacyl-ACP synthase [Novimethylophilus kurashikiensis]|uniref:3-oxoacyl-ACP synthase n=1 Tax=Novimethylophilus kurashikiensis TaxID=1825523 RepID=A0A2R5FD84_9PROT|nr:beta-ketoacyl synthase chain length factor [Novimethylophilus kurashikiensis]GBG15779.1 3-oxoacyl-ACP synthase [Novimethylophilus kurashikiensis]
MMSKALTAYIEGIGLIGRGLPDWTIAREVLAGRMPYELQPAVVPAPQLLPPAERRRCGNIVKLTLAVSSEAVAMAQADASTLPSVFTSSHGDAENCHAICDQLATDDKLISPTRFHNSVHNAASGYWSIATRAMAPASVLCGFDASFGAGLLEAMTQVAVDGTRCLLMAIDTEGPELIKDIRPKDGLLGIALVLSPQPRPQSVARIDIGLTHEAADRFTDAVLEQLRLNIASARGLPLLRQVALGQSGRVVLDYLDGTHIAAEVTPC